MSQPYDICIRGAGIVGRTLALHLATLRLRVALVAQDAHASPAHSDVRAYALSPASRALLEGVRCWPELPAATPVTRMQIEATEGGSVQFDAAQQGVAALNWIVDVPVLEKLLAEAVRFQPLIDVVDTPQAAELTVVCEGRSSSTRTEFGVEFDVTKYHQWALAARVRCTQSHGQVARQWFSDGEILALLPLDGPQGQTCALVWSVHPDRAQELQALDASEFCDALQTASNGALGGLELCSERKVWPLQAAQARRWCGSTPSGSWVLAGDAAHNVHPLAGQGLNLGLGDVAQLVALLEQRSHWRSVGDLRLLRRYERARKADYAVVGGSGDVLQQLFQSPVAAVQKLRTLGMRGFENSGRFKQWITRQAMGSHPKRAG